MHNQLTIEIDEDCKCTCRPFKKQCMKQGSTPTSAVKTNEIQLSPRFHPQTQLAIEEALHQQGFHKSCCIYKSCVFATEVYRYEDRMGHSIVLKSINKQKILVQEHLISARREIDIHKQLNHPNVVQIYDAVETDNEIAIIMEYLPMNNYFVDKIETNNIPFNLKPDGGVQKLKSFTFDILQGLHYIHSRGIIHMDIKPGNFLLSVEQIQEDEWPIVKLCDFGLSRLIGPDGYAISNERAGTEDYIAPEVGKGRITQAVDMWSLGIFLHILTVGYPPNAMRWEPGQELKFLPRYWRKYDGTGLQDFISRCLTLNPSQRITSEEALGHEWINS